MAGTLLESIPPAAQDSPVIARVEMLRIEEYLSKGGFGTPVAIARVIEAIRGVEVGETIKIYAIQTSCRGGVSPEEIGKVGYIAGQFSDFSGQGLGHLFHGEWTLKQQGLF
jgi:hypothetical protein